MNKALLAGSLILIFSLGVIAQEHTSDNARPPVDPGSWVRLNSEEGRFSVLLPELAKDQVETKSSPHGPYTTHLFMAKTSRGIFLVGWVDYAPGFNFSVQSELEANRDNFVKGLKATLLSNRNITMDGHPGLEFTAETSDVAFISRVYVVGRRPYQLIAGTYKGQDDADNVGRFFDSFQITSR